MYELAVPTLNSNDTTYVLVEWFYDDGDMVPAGAEVATVETSKALEGLVCEEGGILRREVRPAQECRPGQVLGRLFATEEQRRAFSAPAPDAAAKPDLVVTEPARRLIEEHGLTLDVFRGTGRRVVGTADVRRILDERPQSGTRVEVDRSQRAVSATVTASHRTIPTAYATVVVTVVDVARKSLPELLIRAVAAQFDRHPRFFAELHDDGGYTVGAGPVIGVTIDVGRGLSMPVLRGAALESPQSIARTLVTFKAAAVRGRFTEADLAGANIGISLPAGDVVQVLPLVMPGHTCMLALGATQVVPHLEPDGRVVARHVAHLTASYDHRLVNGRDAAVFLGDLKRALESPVPDGEASE